MATCARYRVWVFFFQAEDGIRDVAVTGVQTCALPISGYYVGTFFASLANYVIGSHFGWRTMFAVGGLPALLLAWVRHGVTEPERKRDRKSTRLNSSHGYISYAVFCLKKKKEDKNLQHARALLIRGPLNDVRQPI